MGNSSAKLEAWKALEVVADGGAPADACLDPRLHVTAPCTLKHRNTTATFSFDQKGEFCLDDGTVFSSFEGRSKGFSGPITVVRAGDGGVVCVVRGKTGFSADTHWVFMGVPAFDGQDPSDDQLAGFKGDPPLTSYYCHAQIDVKRGMSSGKSTFRRVTGGTVDAPIFSEPVYSGDKLPTMRFWCAVRNAAGEAVAKVSTKSFTSTAAIVEISGNVDFTAVSLCASMLVQGGGGSAGALAGAGVV